ncbi:MAG: hypothetical protein KatS3mg051_2303 [Anaerolineae bacterium]|nr:MAG: hypothetical protein KatS3mg051_2303 [Anaerolineae bacterium]
MVKLSSAFSLSMVPEGGTIDIAPLTADEAAALLVESSTGWARGYYATARRLVAESYIGHEGTARALEKLLDVAVPVRREALKLALGDLLIVAQPIGRRLSPGEELAAPDLQFFAVRVVACPRTIPRLLEAIRREYGLLPLEIRAAYRAARGEPEPQPGCDRCGSGEPYHPGDGSCPCPCHGHG